MKETLGVVFCRFTKGLYCRPPDTIAKLDHYGIRWVSNYNHYASISGYDPDLDAISCGVPQGSVLGPLLFLLYINDLNRAIKFYKVHHFTDDTNLLCLRNSIKNTEQTS